MSLLIENRKARFEYEIRATLYAGIVLLGAEVKSVRGKHGSLAGSYVKIVGNEAWLLNAQISPYAYADNRDYDPKRTRKLLLRRSEIVQLQVESDRKGTVLVPLTIEAQGRHLKLKIGIGRGKKQYEKKAVLKERAAKRELDREFKGKLA